MGAYQAAITRGQHNHADGLFFGGTTPTWSNQTLRKVLRTYAGNVPRVGWIDIHTGLGPSGVGERICACRVDNGQSRDAIDKSQLFQFHEGFAKRAAVSQISTGNHDPVRHFPSQRFQHAVHDRLLAFEPKRIDTVDQIDTEFLRNLFHASHRIVEIARNLDG